MDNGFVLLSSPQFLEGRGKRLLQKLHQSRLIKLVIMDKLHLSHHFGRSFRAQFKSLKTLLFNKLHPLTPILLMTATCSLSIVESLEELFSFHITDQHWPTVSKMANRNESFHATYSTLGICYVKKMLPNYLTSDKRDVDKEVLPSKIMFMPTPQRILRVCRKLWKSSSTPMRIQKS